MIHVLAQRRHIERHCKRFFSISPYQLHLLCAVYLLNQRQMAPKLSEICKYIGEPNVNNAYSAISQLESKNLILHTSDSFIVSKGVPPKRYSIMPKGIEVIDEVKKMITAYQNMII